MQKFYLFYNSLLKRMLQEAPSTEWIKFLQNICSLSDPEKQGRASRKLQLLESEGLLPRKEGAKITSVHSLFIYLAGPEIMHVWSRSWKSVKEEKLNWHLSCCKRSSFSSTKLTATRANGKQTKINSLAGFKRMYVFTNSHLWWPDKLQNYLEYRDQGIFWLILKRKDKKPNP